MKEGNINVDPGVKDVVQYLSSNGFKVLDGWDGTTDVEWPEDMPFPDAEKEFCSAPDFPHIMCEVPKDVAIQEADRMHSILKGLGLRMLENDREFVEEDEVVVEVLYSPMDTKALLTVTGLDDTMLCRVRH